MGFFTPRERQELNRPADIAEFAPPRRVRSPDLADNAGSMQRMTDAPLQKIDDLIAELHMRRERLLSESARVQREVSEYARLSQSTMESTKIITEALSKWRNIPAAVSESTPIVPADETDGDATPIAPDDSGAETQATGIEATAIEPESASSKDERSEVQG